MTPPVSLLRELKAYDDALALRWLPRCQRWCVVKKMDDRVGQLLKSAPNPYKSPKGLDRYDVWREGFDDVLFIKPEDISNTALVMAALADADIHRQGGREALNRRLEELDAQQEAETQRAIGNWAEAASSEAYDMLAWREHRRMAVTNPDPLEKLEHHEAGFLIRERRSACL